MVHVYRGSSWSDKCARRISPTRSDYMYLQNRMCPAHWNTHAMPASRTHGPLEYSGGFNVGTMPVSRTHGPLEYSGGFNVGAMPVSRAPSPYRPLEYSRGFNVGAIPAACSEFGPARPAFTILVSPEPLILTDTAHTDNKWITKLRDSLSPYLPSLLSLSSLPSPSLSFLLSLSPLSPSLSSLFSLSLLSLSFLSLSLLFPLLSLSFFSFSLIRVQYSWLLPHLHSSPTPNHTPLIPSHSSCIPRPPLVSPGRPQWEVGVHLSPLYDTEWCSVMCTCTYTCRLYLWNIQRLRHEPPLSHSHTPVPPDAHACVSDSWQSPAQPCGLTDMLVWKY